MWRAVGPERAIGGVVYAASAVIAPGVIELENPNARVVFGEPDGRLTKRVEMFAAPLRSGADHGRGDTGDPRCDLEQAAWAISATRRWAC